MCFGPERRNLSSMDAMRIRLLMLGKTGREEMRCVLDDYVKRIGRACPIEITEVRDGDAALKKLDGDRAATVVLLDATGKSLESRGFAKWLGEQRDRGTREIIFLCGDAEGFPDILRERAHQKLSLSAMTYSHELARVMLAEQLYRAFAILSGSPYPK
jgi:23S rRNA (pseudouridine1915-N3)-methyltransferase